MFFSRSGEGRGCRRLAMLTLAGCWDVTVLFITAIQDFVGDLFLIAGPVNHTLVQVSRPQFSVL